MGPTCRRHFVLRPAIDGNRHEIVILTSLLSHNGVLIPHQRAESPRGVCGNIVGGKGEGAITRADVCAYG